LNTPPATTPSPIARGARVLVVLAALAALAFLNVPAATAAPSCGRQVIDDWWDGRIDGTYELHCYDDAIESLPRDVRDYSSAEDDIKRALQAAMRGEPAPPNKAGTPASDGGTTTTTTTTTTTPTPSGNEPPAGPDASPPLGESAGSVPVPLLILGGLALLLVAGGSAGYILRRFQRRRLPPPAL
jgi:hypothetical protein